jgi:pyruvate dehydrogenase E1 component beta subunit
MREIQFREALREALNEEMRKNDKIFLMGEEVAEYNGAYKVSQGMLDEFGAKRIIDTPIAELGFSGIGIGAAMNGLVPIIEFMTFNFSLVAIDQVINERRTVFLPYSFPWPYRQCRSAWCTTLSEFRELVRQLSRT